MATTKTRRRKKAAPMVPTERKPEKTTDDLYEVLGVSRDASDRDILAGYRRQQQRWHPDRNPGDDTAAAKFRQVQDAFDVLSDPARKERYDATGEWQAGTADNSLAETMEIVCSSVEAVVGSMIQAGKSVKATDVADDMRRVVRESLQRVRQKAKELESNRDQAGEFLKRVKNDEKGLVGKAAKIMYDRFRDQAAKARREAIAFKKAADYLKGIGYDYEKVTTMNVGVFSGHQFYQTSSTSSWR